VNTLWHDDDLDRRFNVLTGLLQQTQHFWRHHAFKHLELPWQHTYPALSAQLRKLSLVEAEQLSADEAALFVFAKDHLPLAAEMAAACDLGEFSQTYTKGGEAYAVPGRKLQQIEAFAGCVPVNKLPIVEWCAGKAHLGRFVAKQRDCNVIALERCKRLIEVGRDLAAREQVSISFLQMDVMTSQAISALNAQQNAIALHACGDLHLQFLRDGAQQRVHSLTLAPCCYHLISDDASGVLSKAAKNLELQLCRDDLRTAVHGSVTAPLRERKKRQQLQAWRLGFDLLQRELRGIDEYLATPALPTTVLQIGFADFCAKLAAHHHLPLPHTVDYPHYESAGHARLQAVTAFDLARVAHRRPLEIWLVLDRALFLREQGYAVAVGKFCQRALTPRNILIRAELLHR
jgi:hypothetical protein